MKRKRLIPLLLLKNGWLVQSKRFQKHQNLGNPVSAVRRLSEWASDEIIYLDISKNEEYDMRRDDINHPNRTNFLEIIQDVSKETFMPMTVGGKIKSLQDAALRIQNGGDKISLNTGAVDNPNLIEEIAKEFGSQCVVISIDAKKTESGYLVFTEGGTRNTGMDPVSWARKAVDRGAGEILLNSIDRDGTKIGFDIPLIQSVAKAVKTPVIACGGAGEWEHFEEVFTQTDADAVCAGNVFHHIDQSVYLAKKYLVEKKLNLRNPDLLVLG